MNNLDKVVIALDLGTTGNRAIAFDKNGEIVGDSYHEFKQIHPRPAWVEQDPVEILNSALRVLKETIQKSLPRGVNSIGITNQRETVVIWNKKNGKPVYNAIVWQCRRTADICRSLAHYRGLVKEKTGLFLDPYFSATKIAWILDSIGGARKSAEKGELAFGTVDSWILWNITGGRVHATESSNASRTLLYNINTLEYDEELLKIFSVPSSILPEVFDSANNFGITDKEIMGYEIPVVGILGDQQASLFAHAGLEKGIIKNTYGTGLFVMVETGKTVYQAERLISTIAWRIDQETYYALEGSIFSGGSVIKYIKDSLNLIGSVEESSDVARALDSNEGVYFVPALTGLGAPFWDPEARGLIIGLTGSASRNHIVRAAVESLAYQTKDVIDEFENAFGWKLSPSGYKLRVDGKACANEFLMQFQSDILNMTVEKAAVTEMTGFGIAGLSAISTGFWTKDAFAGFKKIGKTYYPEMSEGQRDGYCRKWKKAVSKSLNWAKTR